MPKLDNVYTERKFSYNCENTSKCLEILEKIEEELSLEAEIQVEMRSNKLIFKVIGLEPNVISAVNKIKDFLSLYNSPKLNPRRGIPSEIIAKQIKKTIPLDILVHVLKKSLNIDASIRGSLIYADTDLDTVITIAKKISEIQQKIEPMSFSNSLKKLLIAAITIYNVSHVEILEVLQNLGYLNEKNELTVPWIQALEELSQILSEESIT